MDTFAVLKAKLASHPSGAPDTPELDEILHILFTPADAALVQHLSFDPEPAEVVARMAGLPVNEVGDRCEAMARKGIALAVTRAGVRRYAMLPVIPGLYEYPLMLGPREGLDYERLCKLWVQYYEGAWGREMDSHTPTRARVLPINRTLEDASSVLPFEQVVDFIKEASVVAVGTCACRVTARKCDAPRETCFYLNSHGAFVLDIGAGRQLSEAEALDLLREMEEAGLVHVASNKSAGGNIICNCCRCCCCTILRSRIAATGLTPVAGYECRVDTEKCIACGVCIDRCPTGSILVDDVAVIDARTCLGCGLCATACPTEAMRMRRRADAPSQLQGPRVEY